MLEKLKFDAKLQTHSRCLAEELSAYKVMSVSLSEPVQDRAGRSSEALRTHLYASDIWRHRAVLQGC